MGGFAKLVSTMSRPLTFSVGIPTFNQAEFLEETILSLLNQTRPPDEIVISDHYSTDHTPDIIAKYASHVRGVIPPPGCGISGQWDFTLTSLSGDWVTLLSSDDVARPNFCETLIRGACRRDDAVLVRAGWENIDKAGAVLSREYLLSVKAVTMPPTTLTEQKHGPKCSFAAFAVKRDVLEASGGYPKGMESFGDWPMYMQIAPFGSFIYESEIISGYRMGHDGNKFRKRIGLWIRDEERMFYEVMPLAAERAKMADRSWIGEASRKNFLRYLASASREFTAEERAEIAPLFTSWAARVNAEALVNDFASGKIISDPKSITERGISYLRPFAKKIISRVRR
jgi:glycosyltransferase involved in cell wall biosynthesis